jgi:hypothetical protein
MGVFSSGRAAEPSQHTKRTRAFGKTDGETLGESAMIFADGTFQQT